MLTFSEKVCICTCRGREEMKTAKKQKKFLEEVDVVRGISHEGEREAGRGVVWPRRKKRRERGPQAQNC
jgi:hypothetical protein